MEDDLGDADVVRKRQGVEWRAGPFEIRGGHYRLIVAYFFAAQVAYVKFVGTHADYDSIDPFTVADF